MRIWERVLYVDEDGVLYEKKELEKYHWKTIKLTKETISYEKHGIHKIATTREIKILGKKAEQQSLF